MDQHNEGITPTSNPVVSVATTDSASAAKESPATVAPAQILSGTDTVKLFAILGYVLPFLFFLPLTNDATKHNEYSRFHANQQCILLLCWVAAGVVSNNVLYPIFGYGVHSLVGLLHIGLLVFSVLGIVNAVNSVQKELPVIGQFKIFK